MRLFLLAALIFFYGAGTAHTADRVQVRAFRANVRAAPSVRSKILTKLSRGKIVQEIDRKGKWTQVLLGSKHPPAWIHSSLLSPLPSPFARFQADYVRLNRDSRSTSRHELFSRVRDAGNGVVYIETSSVWDALSAREQTTYIESLYRSWKNANDSGPVTLHLYDGKTHRLRSDLAPLGD